MYDKQALPINSVLKGKNYNYCIKKVLGQGSFGITYLASIEIKGSLGTINSNAVVAIKEFFMRDLNVRYGTSVSTGSNSDLYHNYRKDFIREANNLSKLSHPNIVKVLEAFEENNTAYFSMEYIEGANLNDYIQSNGSLSEREALENIIQVAGALSHMHNTKMLHLDLKPLNIMRRQNGDLVLIDFGLSKQFNSEGEPESSTRIGAGTFGYAPLEQSSYKKEDGFSPTLDIYALGGTLYKMLTGITPPSASTIFNEGFPENSMKDKGICQDVISLTLWAMEPMKRKRPQTIEELLNEIKRILPYTSKVKKDPSPNSSPSYNEPTLEVFEVCNDFHVHWNNATEEQKNKIRNLLCAMQKIGEKKQCVMTEYGEEQIDSKPVMSLGECSWEYLYPILTDLISTDGIPLSTLDFVLKAILHISLLTGLPFRLSDEDEIRYTGAWRFPILCYSKNKTLQYKTYGTDTLNDVNWLHWHDRYDIQLVCDGLKPVHNDSSFDVPCTQEPVNEIIPIGFNLYKVRKGNLWNIKSPESPMASYLGLDYEMISNIGRWHVPGGGPTSGFDYFGIETYRSGLTYYYSFEIGKFRLLEILSAEDIAEREAWT